MWIDLYFNELIGKTLTKIEINDKNDEIYFTTSENETYKLYHWQDCCENVYIEDITGDLDDLLNSPITMAEEISEAGEEDTWGTSTWTFYKLATNNGYVTIRWLGESNGYYSEAVDFAMEVDKEDWEQKRLRELEEFEKSEEERIFNELLDW